MHRVKISQLGKSSSSDSEKKLLSISTELPFIPQIGSKLKLWPYVDGKVKDVWHDFSPPNPINYTHEIILHDMDDSFSDAVNWKNLPANVAVKL